VVKEMSGETDMNHYLYGGLKSMIGGTGSDGLSCNLIVRACRLLSNIRMVRLGQIVKGGCPNEE
jgi:hypothetical protein